jgi:fucose permease
MTTAKLTVSLILVLFAIWGMRDIAVGIFRGVTLNRAFDFLRRQPGGLMIPLSPEGAGHALERQLAPFLLSNRKSVLVGALTMAISSYLIWRVAPWG